jgi:hypothetical protein
MNPNPAYTRPSKKVARTKRLTVPEHRRLWQSRLTGRLPPRHPFVLVLLFALVVGRLFLVRVFRVVFEKVAVDVSDVDDLELGGVGSEFEGCNFGGADEGGAGSGCEAAVECVD